MPRYLLITLLICSCFGQIFAQEIQNINAIVDGGKVTLHYDLIHSDKKETFDIKIYSSHNGFSSPLREVTGDIGKDVKPGYFKTVVWSAGKELINYAGDITFEIRGVSMAAALRFKNPTAGGSLRRGKTAMLEWNNTEIFGIELYQNGSKVMTISGSAESGRFPWAVPSDIKPGKNYDLKIKNLKKPSQEVFSGSFTIKRKIPIIVKALPLAVLAAAAVVLTGGEGGSGDPVEDPNNTLPSPPNPE